MQLEDSFEVPAPVERVWDYMLDVEKVAPCAPGAELTEIVDDRTWKGKVNIKLGAVSLSYAGTVVMEERDEAGRRVVLRARGSETRGKGVASALVTSTMEPTEDGGTRIRISTDLSISGAVAQYGRGLIADVSQRLTGEFAECIRGQLSAEPGEAPPPVVSRPVGGIRLGLWALFRAIGRFFRRIFGRSSAPR